MDERTKKLELLSPAGNLESFWAAVEKKTDAVYIGWGSLNARVQADNFSLHDISRMIPFAHKHGVKVYVALNILFKEEELPEVIEGLTVLEAIAPDALIIQDLGVYHLLKNYFPRLRLHGSTLMTVCNHLGAEHLRQLGFRRVVLARELSIDEIAAIHKAGPIHLEVFVHGALCYTFSGLCLMSSYLGGKSSMRGRCVQPCRRVYRSGKKEGRFFSMNDLCGIRLLPELRKAGVSSVKIEGRMRSAHYVSAVVEAYRTVIDAPDGDEEALGRAEHLIKECLGRRPTPGYFFFPRQSEEIITPHFAGTAGLFLGKVLKIRPEGAVVRLAAQAGVGDRLRIVDRESGEQQSFTLKRMSVTGEYVSSIIRGQEGTIEIPAACSTGDLIFKVDAKGGGELRGSGRIRKIIFGRAGDKAAELPARRDKRQDDIARSFFQARPAAAGKRGRLAWWVRLADLEVLRSMRQAEADRVLVVLNRRTFAQYRRLHRRISAMRQYLSWALPAVIEEAQCGFYEEAVSVLLRAGFVRWNLGHPGQRLLFAKAGRDVSLSSSYTCNVLNSVSARSLHDMGISEIEFSIETDIENLKKALARLSGFSLGLTVYGRPPLFTSRLRPPGLGRRITLRSPRGEPISIDYEGDLTLVRSLHTYSVIDHIRELEKCGLSFVVVDLTWDTPSPATISRILKGGSARERSEKPDTFNMLRTLS